MELISSDELDNCRKCGKTLGVTIFTGSHMVTTDDHEGKPVTVRKHEKHFYCSKRCCTRDGARVVDEL